MSRVPAHQRLQQTRNFTESAGVPLQELILDQPSQTYSVEHKPAALTPGQWVEWKAEEWREEKSVTGRRTAAAGLSYSLSPSGS